MQLGETGRRAGPNPGRPITDYPPGVARSLQGGDMRIKSLSGWVKRHRTSIDGEIRAAGIRGRISDGERAEWVANVEWLYLWAVRDGVDFNS